MAWQSAQAPKGTGNNSKRGNGLEPRRASPGELSQRRTATARILSLICISVRSRWVHMPAEEHLISAHQPPAPHLKKNYQKFSIKFSNMHTGKSTSRTPRAIKPEHLCNPHPDGEVNIGGSQNPLQTSGSQLPCSDLRLNHKACRCHTLLISLVHSRPPRMDSEYASLTSSFRILFAVDLRCSRLCALDIFSRSAISYLISSIPPVFFFMSFAF